MNIRGISFSLIIIAVLSLSAFAMCGNSQITHGITKIGYDKSIQANSAVKTLGQPIHFLLDFFRK